MNKTLIIAEAGVNHNGSSELAFRLIDAAANAGADIVKFQTFKTDLLVTVNAPKAGYQKKNSSESDESQYEMLRKLELSKSQHLELMEHCLSRNIRFWSTAFDNDSIDLLAELGISMFKVPSGEITNKPFLQKIGKTAGEVILSTGMATIEEISDAIEVLTNAGLPKEKITLLHCTTEYPAPIHEVNLRAMATMRETFGLETGYSDHTQGIEIPIAAVTLGATVIEKHFTLDRNLPGPDHKSSLEPDELKKMVEAIRKVEVALGDGVKQPTPSEIKNRIAARKSIHLAHDLPEGHILMPDDLIMKRPGDGISPMHMDFIIGRKLLKTVTANTKLQMNFIK
ncbi:MAG TPA: N-acetylneuraminate synthase [Bacteroidales bacterium]|nr:MAG: N-acetylneuraminate synthase [Bacteroidetes bacterium GWE2_42_24]OFY27516.1 MAG: N-acetylneuraminate synthase [Bacteroidetes bacterium GWF2_43_11]HBZ66039.1 N-acetylneuraminate synthase [Bacteroidales bacterium]